MKNEKLHINLNLIITIILVIISIISITFVIEKFIFKEDSPNILGFSVLQVASGSMSGTFEINDIIVIRKYKNEADVANGDVITFKKGDSLITHRIVDICKTTKETLYETKGDANESKD